MKHTISLFLTLVAFWLLNSGHYSLLILSLGFASIALILVIAHKMDVVDHESQPIYLSRKIFGYYIWLIKEIIKANITVVKHIWLGEKSISPTLKAIKVSQKTDMGKVIYANSITLTPGTVAIDIVDNEITVHALLYKDIESLEIGEMDRRVTLLER
ncbi:Na+/H+ antiporter subunit E [Pseudoalteromonas denitrificans]|uniref:Multisubunit sodium/proton antiporter, MrpE subunit n=1 Tax=Pseudoalteromonas denitrificans DSM 6059 TaxID=1123010 RepID=A0A1I1S879_9GAMM|nr:Na+/H+ antiporter subunit E [Pseudoalteromonas denitrificans]SFD42562.1 multisubunit sodium/proton antiporter, MrpE subunit [Pseudoalteromonas denitrificans DSM 6059]